MKTHTCRNGIFKTQLNKIGTTPLVLHQPYILCHVSNHALWCLLHECRVWQLWCLLISCISGVVHIWAYYSFTVNILKVCSHKCRCHYPCKLLEKEGVGEFLSGTFSDDQWFKNEVCITNSCNCLFAGRWELYVNDCMWSESMAHCLVGMCSHEGGVTLWKCGVLYIRYLTFL